MTLFTESDADIAKCLVLAQVIIDITPYAQGYETIEKPGLSNFNAEVFGSQTPVLGVLGK